MLYLSLIMFSLKFIIIMYIILTYYKEDKKYAIFESVMIFLFLDIALITKAIQILGNILINLTEKIDTKICFLERKIKSIIYK